MSAYESESAVVVTDIDTAHGEVFDGSGVGGWRVRAIIHTTEHEHHFVLTFKQAMTLGYRLIHDALRAWWHNDNPGEHCPDETAPPPHIGP